MHAHNYHFKNHRMAGCHCMLAITFTEPQDAKLRRAQQLYCFTWYTDIIFFFFSWNTMMKLGLQLPMHDIKRLLLSAFHMQLKLNRQIFSKKCRLWTGREITLTGRWYGQEPGLENRGPKFKLFYLGQWSPRYPKGFISAVTQSTWNGIFYMLGDLWSTDTSN